ncbi:MAG: T9SS type A sorting domain-containing protein [Bacteroidia bacterium]
MKQKISLALFIILVTTTLLKAQWTQLNEPTGGYCWGLTRVGNEIWAGTNFGVYTSANDGATWAHHPTLFNPTLSIKTIGDTVILMIQEQISLYVYHLLTVTSYDVGLTWNTPVLLETSSDSYLAGGERELIVTDSSLIVRSNTSKYYISYDTGQTWDTLPQPSIYTIISAHTKKFLLSATYFPTKGAHYSNNGGTTWNLIDTVHLSQISLIVDSTFYIPSQYSDTSTHYYIARTSDFGQTWDTLALDLFTYSNGFITSFNGKLYYGNYPYPQSPVIYESSDNGDTWTLSAIPPEFYMPSDERSLLLYNWDWIIIYNYNLYRYSPYSNTYYPTTTGMNARDITFLHENKGALFAKANYKVITSYDAGITWHEAPSFVSSNFNFCFKGDTIIGTTTQTNYQSTMCYSYDNGFTWDTVHFINGQHWQNPSACREINGRLYISNLDHVAYSDDWGLTWDSLSTTIDSTCGFGSPMRFEDLEVANNNLFVFDYENGLVAKLDTSSYTWKNKFCPNVFAVYDFDLSYLDNKLVLTADMNYYTSSDYGETWVSPANIGWPTTYPPHQISSVNGVWFSPSYNGNLYYTLNFGDNWQQLSTPNHMFIPSNSATETTITSLNGILFVGGNGIWRSDDTLQLISGNVYFDNNNNGTKDLNENGIAGNLLYTTPFNIAFNADSTGNYLFLTAAVGDTLRPALPTNFCSSNPPYYLTNGAASNVDFGIYFYPGIQDLAVDITNTNHFRPGFNTNIEVTVSNLGTVALPGQLQVNLDSNLTYVSSSIAPSQIIGNAIFFITDTLYVLESQKISIQTETNFMVPFGTQINCDASVQPIIGDTVPTNNYSQLTDSVVASYDPNEKLCASGMYFTPTQVLNGDEMIYTIRFQNLGNIQADNIHVIDSLSDLFDFQSFRIISSSHDMHYFIAGSAIATFYFDNIFLPPAITDEPGSHGFVKFAIKFKSGVSIGNAVANKAYIYFDFNPPIITNTATTIVADPPANLGVIENKSSSDLLIYPNPANEILNIKLMMKGVHSFNLVVYNQLGKVVKSSFVHGNNFTLNVNDLPNGLNYGKVFISELNKQMSFRFIRMN